MSNRRSFAELRCDLEQQAKWRMGLDRLPASTCVDFLHMDITPLKESLLPVSQQAFKQVVHAHQHGACIAGDGFWMVFLRV